MKLFYWFCFLFLISCSTVIIDKQFEPYLPKGFNSVSVNFADLAKINRAAECYNYEDYDFVPNEIKIDTKEWNQINEQQKQWLINHEVGHCVFNKQHDNTIDSDGCPTSNMFWHIPNAKCVERSLNKGIK